MASIKVKLNTQRITKKGYPIVIQVIHNRKCKLIYTPYHLTEKEFCAKKQIAITRSTSSKKHFLIAEINKYLETEVNKLKQSIERLEQKGQLYDITMIIMEYEIRDQKNDFLSYTLKLIKEIENKGNEGTAIAYKTALNKILHFYGDKQPFFEEINKKTISDFEQFLRLNNAKTNTINSYMRIFKAIYNRAFNEGIISKPENPFANYHMQTFKGNGRAINKDLLRKIADIDLTNQPHIAQARDIFLFSFYTRGMPFVDCSFLKKENIIDNNICYERQKTKQMLRIEINPQIKKIIDKYAYLEIYILPILNENIDLPLYNQYRNALRKHNKRLHILGETLKLEHSLSSYVSRHSWATIAKHEGISLSIISEGLGHTSEKTTYAYLASFDKSTLTQANEIVTTL